MNELCCGSVLFGVSIFYFNLLSFVPVPVSLSVDIFI